MCLGTVIYWAHIDKIYYGNDKDDAKAIDFDDSFIYDELAFATRRAPPSRLRCAYEYREAIKSL